MSVQRSFTDEQWQLLIDTPALVGAAVMVCSRSGAVGTTKEAFALTRGLLDAPDELEDNEIVREIVNHRRSGEEGSNDWQSRYQGANPAQLEKKVLDCCQEVSRLLSALNHEDAAGCKRWIHSVGVKVAKASAEGGFLGFGGERISAEEDRLLEAVERALELA